MMERFGRSDEHKARIFVQFSMELLAQKGWPQSRVGVAEFSIQEIVDNAFLHGLEPGTSAGTIRISVLLSSHWIRCSVKDDGLGFTLSDVLKAQSLGEERGLAKVKALAMKLTQPDPNTIAVTIASDPGKISLSEHNRVFVVTLAGDFRPHGTTDYPDIQALPQSIPTGSKVILDLSKMSYANSMGLRLFTILQRQLLEKSCQIVVVIAPNSRMREIFEISRYSKLFACVESLDAAFKHCDASKTEDVVKDVVFEW